MAPDQCIFVPMMCNTIYEKKKIFAPRIYPGGVFVRNIKKDTAITACCLFYILCSFPWVT